MAFDTGYDYVVVGAGTAGSVVAARLAADPERRVLLIEAGGPDERSEIERTDLPATASLWADASVSWGYQTVSQPGLDGRRVFLTQGRVVGGGGSINAMLHVRGNRRDFDRWSRDGCVGWSYDDVLGYFKRSESYPGGDGAYRGTTGPLEVTDLECPSAASQAFVAAAGVAGYATPPFDYNAGRQHDAAFFYQSTRTAGGHRASTAARYLRPMTASPNLTVVTNARADRLVMAGSQVTGVEYHDGQGDHRVSAAVETILACGALASPAMLLRSGVGPAEELRARGIAVALDLPGVGRNLQDHLLVGMAYESRQPLAPPRLLAEAGLFTYTAGDPRQDSPDLQLFVGPVKYVPDEYLTDGPGFTFAPVVAQPRSRGSVRIRSAEPTDLPAVDPAYLSDPADLDVLLAGIALARELAHTEPFGRLRGRELAPGADATKRSDLSRYIRQAATTVWHPVGTCRMGVDADAVVDPQLRVNGLEGIRVVDASVMPSIPCGNTNAATVMVAEKAVDMLGVGAAVAAAPARREEHR